MQQPLIHSPHIFVLGILEGHIKLGDGFRQFGN